MKNKRASVAKVVALAVVPVVPLGLAVVVPKVAQQRRESQQREAEAEAKYAEYKYQLSKQSAEVMRRELLREQDAIIREIAKLPFRKGSDIEREISRREARKWRLRDELKGSHFRPTPSKYEWPKELGSY